MGRRSPRLHAIPHLIERLRGSVVHYYYDAGGKPRKQIPLGTDRTLALQQWAKLEGDQPAPEGPPTFRDAVTRYERDILPRKAPKTARDQAHQLKPLLAFFTKNGTDPAPLDAILPLHCRQYLDTRLDAPIAALREFALLSHILTCARGWGYMNQPNPCVGITREWIKLHRIKTRRDVYIERPVLEAVLEHADLATRNAIRLAYLTAQRPADVLAITEAAIDGDELVVTQAKTRKRLRIRLTRDDGHPNDLGRLIDELKDTKRAIRDALTAAQKPNVLPLHLLVTEAGQRLTAHALRYRFDHARTEAIKTHPDLAEQIRQFQYRDLRAKSGTDIQERLGRAAAQELLGHETDQTTTIYLRNRRGIKVEPTG